MTNRKVNFVGLVAGDRNIKYHIKLVIKNIYQEKTLTILSLAKLAQHK
ncbi:hypothetical protein H6G76_17635 [Nostoc sp. FACHB-152]|nr:hypothetical protein [Nostoc sp. FACHB-152]